jgi:acylphosphatase
MIRRRVIVHGRVQGVFFRDSTRRMAQQRGVAGWVANRADGAVEAVFEGDEQSVERLVAFTREGPRGAEVSNVEVTDEAPEGLSGFAVRRGRGQTRRVLGSERKPGPAGPWPTGPVLGSNRWAVSPVQTCPAVPRLGVRAQDVSCRPNALQPQNNVPGTRPVYGQVPSGYSHSIVAGGFELRSSATRFTPGISLMIRLEIVSRRSYGKRAQSAVIASSDVTARMTIG